MERESHLNSSTESQPTLAEKAALGEQIAQHAAHLDAATHRLLTDLREFDRVGGWYPQGARNCAAWLSWRLGWSLGTARDHVRVATRLGTLPMIDEALRKGELSYCKVRALTRVATAENEALLLEDARYTTGAQLDRICRKYGAVLRVVRPSVEEDALRRHVTRRDLDDGMVKIEAVLHPEEAAAVWEALTRVATERAQPAKIEAAPVLTTDATDATAASATAATAASATAATAASATAASATAATAAAATAASATAASATAASATAASAVVDEAAAGKTRRPYPFTRLKAEGPRFCRADALVAVAESILRGDRRERSPVELVVTVAADVLDRSNPDAPQVAVAADGTCLSFETVRRLACDCGVAMLIEDADGNPLSVGRKTRTIPASMKRALLKRDQTCRFPGCCSRVFLDGHHATHWADGGETALENMLLLCKFHHRFVHEYGYRVELDDQQNPRFHDPRGRLVPETPPRPASAGMSDVYRLNAPLAITPSTNTPLWDGQPVNYGWVIDDLVQVDRLE